jgi:hypothetical protein
MPSETGLASRMRKQAFPTILALNISKVLTKPCPYSNNIGIAKPEGGHNGNSLLHEVQEKGRDKKPEASYTQEPSTSNTGCLSHLRHKGI